MADPVGIKRKAVVDKLVSSPRFKKPLEFVKIRQDQAGMDFQNAVEIRGNSVNVSENSIKLTGYWEKSMDSPLRNCRTSPPASSR
jgi:hypothetical protein